MRAPLVLSGLVASSVLFLAPAFSEPGQAVWCNGKRYWGACPSAVPPPPVEAPSVTEGRNLYNQGVDANKVDDFARAAELFNQAYNRDGKIDYLNAYKRARAKEYGVLASRAWDEENWDAAIKLYQQALSLYDFPYIAENLKKVRAHQSAGWASQNYENDNYDLAITYWEQAYGFWPNPIYLENITYAKKAKAATKARKAFAEAGTKARKALAERQFADLEAAAAEMLKLDPTNSYAVEMLAIAPRLRAEARLKEGKDGFGDALEGYQRAMAAFAEFARRGGKGGTERMYELRDTGVAVLAKLVHKAGNIDNLVRFYESWGGDSKTARQIISGEIGITLPALSSPQASIPVLPPAATVRPADLPAIATAIDAATGPARQPATPVGPGAVAASNGRDCFDQNCSVPSIRFIPSNQFVPAERETPQMKQLHREIDEIARSIGRVAKSLIVAERTNSFHAPELEQQRETLTSQHSAKKQEYDNIRRTMQLD